VARSVHHGGVNPTEADTAGPQESCRLRAWHLVGLALAGVVVLVLVAGLFEAISLQTHPPALLGQQAGQAATTSVRLRTASEVLEPWLGVVALLAAVVLELPWHLTAIRPTERTGLWQTTRSVVIAVTTVLALATSARILDVLTGHVYSDGSVVPSAALRLSAAAELFATLLAAVAGFAAAFSAGTDRRRQLIRWPAVWG
jgi:hypothetical protein